MAVLKDYRCIAHGVFESRTAICPHGCSTVIAVWDGKAPAGRSEKTKASDRALTHLAARYGLDDMSNRNGSVGGSRRAPDGMAPTWGEIPKGNIYEVGKGEVTRDGRERIDSQGGAAGLGAQLNAGLSELEQTAGALPTFMDIAKVLPRVRPIPAINPVDGKFQNSADLDKAITSS